MQRVSSTDPAMPTERLLRHALISPLPLCSIPVVHVEMGIEAKPTVFEIYNLMEGH